MAGLELETKPWYVALIIGLILGAGLIWASENFVFKETRQEIQNQTARLEELREKVRQGRAVAKDREAFRQRVEQLETEWARLLRILPTAKQTDELIKKIKALTERGSFRFVRFQPQRFVKRDFYSEWPINVNLQGTYHELALFFDRLARFSRIINVDSAQVNALRRRGGSPYTITTNFTMKTFVYGDPDKAGVQ